MPDADAQGWEAGFRKLAADTLRAQRAQRDALNQQIAALKAQRDALDSLIEPLEKVLTSASDAPSAEEPPTDRPLSEPAQPYLEQSPEQPLGAVDAAVAVLRAAAEPLHFRVITERALNAGLWQSNAIKPENSIKGALNDHIRKAGAASKFRRVGPGMFALQETSDHPSLTDHPDTT